jgi:aminoglycoside phosphotransferase family enzyme
MESISLAEKVAFLGSADAHGHTSERVTCRETHMSWVFLVGDRVYKLKKPVRFPYLDFSSLERRHAACVAELVLNRRLAPDVYQRIVPLVRSGRTLRLGGPGEIVDWLVVMRRLDEAETLEHALLTRQLTVGQLDPLIATLARFYHRAGRVSISPSIHLSNWRRNLADNRRVLLDPRLGLPSGLVRRLDRVLRRFLAQRSEAIAARARRRCIVDGHGDLRPEHIWPGPPVRIIDCLEFNPQLRAIDPLDEIAYLGIECARLGGEQYGAYLTRRIGGRLPGGFSEELFTFYRCYRAMLRARLAIAHLLEPEPRTPAKWPRLARAYLELASREASRLERLLGGRSPRVRAAHWPIRSCATTV